MKVIPCKIIQFSFLQLLLNKGELDGMRIFNPLTVHHAIMEVGKPEIGRTVMIPMRYGAGMILGNKPIGMLRPFYPICLWSHRVQ